MSPSAYDPDLIQDAIRHLNLACIGLEADPTLTVREYQTPGKWGFQAEPIAFRRKYSEILSELHDRISKANQEVQTLRDSLARILQDVNDIDASAAAIANQIAADRNTTDTTTQHI